ncbi:MAG: WD40 repeat domain-containing protein [Fimbriimonadales bacterium]|nr:WD40 repeat domain-containing protein [Fimbriimonadales bacterium]
MAVDSLGAGFESRVALSNGATRVAFIRDDVISVFDTSTKRLIANLDALDASSIVMSPNGQQIAINSESGGTTVVQIDDPEKFVHLGDGSEVYFFSADSKRAFGTVLNPVENEFIQLCVWEVATGAAKPQIKTGLTSIQSLAISKDESIAAIASGFQSEAGAILFPGEFRTYDLNEATINFSLKPDRSPCTATAISFDGKQVAFSMNARPIEVRHLESGESISSIPQTESARSIRFIEGDGAMVVVLQSEIAVYRSSNGRKSNALRIAADDKVVMSHCGSFAAVVSTDGTLRMWNSKTGQIVFSDKTASAADVTFSKDGTVIAFIAPGEVLKAVRTSTGEPQTEIPIGKTTP